MKQWLLRYGNSLGTGVLLALAFPRWSCFWIAWIALVPLFSSTATASPQEGAKRFFLAGWAFHSLVLYWLITNVYWAGGWAFAGYQLLCCIMAGYWAACGWCWRLVSRRLPRVSAPWSLALLWTAMEQLQATLFTGFGWSALGYSQGPDLAVLQWASLGGVGLVSFFVVLVNTLATTAILSLRRRVSLALMAVLVLVLVHAGGYFMLRTQEPPARFRVAALQTNFPLEMKWDPEYTAEMVRNACEKSRAISRERGPIDLMVWPESMLMAEATLPVLKDQITSLVSDTGAQLFSGAHRENPSLPGALNSSYLFDSRGAIRGYYDKIHLAPFGEYVPLANLLPFVQHIIPAIGDIQPGREQRTFEVGSRTFGPLICFEVLFGGLAAKLRAEGADFLVVITNLGWFGESAAIPQEFEIARMRAVETRLPIVHCANTGISGVFDPYGRFQLANVVFDSIGACQTINAQIEPEDTIRQRVAAVFDLPDQAKHPFPSGRVLVSGLVLSLSGVLLLFAARNAHLSRKP